MQFTCAEDEETYVSKLHAEGFRVNYKRKDEEQLEFNKIYDRCRKRRERLGLPPMFGSNHLRLLPYANPPDSRMINRDQIPIDDEEDIVIPVVDEEDEEEEYLTIEIPAPQYPVPSGILTPPEASIRPSMAELMRDLPTIF